MSDSLQTSQEDLNQFERGAKAAETRFKKYKSKDPFPDIQPALLNSADIEDYVRETGIIYPFSRKDLKPASYEVCLRGECLHWDKIGKKQIVSLKGKGDTFCLRPNSIAFVNLDTIFRLPDYIALRFNLRITNVHRGLLLGTGPLIDPGFEGRLLIPLHNLTRNEYTFEYNEGLIWVEFTKLSIYKKWEVEPGGKARSGEYVSFPPSKRELSVEDYIAQAFRDVSQAHSDIRSSIPDVVRNAEQLAQQADQSAKESAASAKNAAEKAESQRVQATVTGVITVLAFVSALIGLVYTVYMLTQDATSYVHQSSQFLTDHVEKIRSLEIEVQGLKKKLENLVDSSKLSVPSPDASIPAKTPDTKPNG